jgi:hypothetical protein
MWFSCSARWNLKLRTRRLRTSTQNIENTTSLYWFGPPESKTLRPVVGVDCLRIAWSYKGRLARLILASGWGRFPDSWSITTWRPKSRLQHLPYPSICLVEIHWCLDCMPSHVAVLNEVVWGIFWKVFRRSYWLLIRSVGPLTGQRVFW